MRAGERLYAAVPGDWADEAACRGKAQVMFPDRTDVDAKASAKAVCGRCPVRLPCLEFAVANAERHGVWGGLTWDERKHLSVGATA